MTIEGVKLVQKRGWKESIAIATPQKAAITFRGHDVNQDQWDWLAMDSFPGGYILTYIYILLLLWVGVDELVAFWCVHGIFNHNM